MVSIFKSQSFKISVFAALIFFGIFTCLVSKAANASANNQSQTSPLNQLKAQLAENKGKVIYVDFWASWCKPCRQSFPWMNDMKARFETKGLKIIGINLDKDPALARQFLLETPAQFEMIYDHKGLTAEKFKLVGMPMSFLFDRSGAPVQSHTGFNELKQKQLELEIIQLLNKE